MSGSLYAAKLRMLRIIYKNGWAYSLGVDKRSSYSEVKEAYEIMLDEMGSDENMYPNGHDDDDYFFSQYN